MGATYYAQIRALYSSMERVQTKIVIGDKTKLRERLKLVIGESSQHPFSKGPVLNWLRGTTKAHNQEILALFKYLCTLRASASADT
eukprot:1477836-Amphidinium_carterae.1